MESELTYVSTVHALTPVLWASHITLNTKGHTGVRDPLWSFVCQE